MSRARAAAAVPGGRAGLLAGADVHPQTGRLLSIAQLQAALRAGVTGLDRPEAMPGGPTNVPPGPNRPRPGADAVVPGWLTALTSPVLVIGAHPGAGCSTVAVAVAEAAAAAGAGTGAGAGAGAHLVEWSDGTGSGLAGVAHAELGVGPSGLWRHGRRGDLTVSRPVDVLPVSPPDAGAGGGVVVVDLGHLGPTAGAAATAGRWPGGPVVVVCRASAPGVRRAEVLLATLQLPVLVAVVGPSRWPGSVRASRGPLLRQREEAGALVGVPQDRRLAVTGLTSAALPHKVAAAGDRLWQLTHAHPPGPPGLPGAGAGAVTTWMTERTGEQS